MLMILLIQLFGALIALAGILIAVNPDTVFGPLRQHSGNPALHGAAVLVRLLIGALLIAQAANSRYPQVITILGWLSVAAAIGLALIGRTNFEKLMNWAFNLVDKFGRLAGLVAILFGAFLVYAFL